MSRRHADNWSHPSHYLVDPYTWTWSPNGHDNGHEWPTATSFVQCQWPSHSEIQLFQKLTMKIHGQGHVRSKVRFDLQNSKVMIMVKFNPIAHIWGLEFNRYVCFSFRGNPTTFGWDIGNSIFDLENSKSRSWPRSNPMVTFEALEFNQYVCFWFRGNRTIFGWDIANSIFDLENSRSRSWPRSNPMVTSEP